MTDLDATQEPEQPSDPTLGEAAPAYSEVVAQLAGATEGVASTGAIADWREASGGKLAVVVGDAGVGSLATLYGAISEAVHVSDRHAHRWRERIRMVGHPLEPSRFAGAVGAEAWDGPAQTSIYAAAARVASAGAIVLEAQSGSAFWDDPLTADLVMVANGDDAGRLSEQLALSLSTSSAVFMAPQRESIADAVREVAGQAGASLHEVATECKLGKIQETADSQKFTIETSTATGGGRFDVELPAAGAHQRTNFAAALLAAGEVEPPQIGLGLKTLRMPLRFESIKTSPWVIVDGAASRPAYRALVRTVEAVLDPRGLLVLATVDGASDLGMLAQTVSDLSGEARIAYREADRVAADELAERLRERRVGVQLAGAPGPALDQMMSGAGSKDTVLMFGSRRATSEARGYLLGLEEDPR